MTPTPANQEFEANGSNNKCKIEEEETSDVDRKQI
jgi:hypothetical protein